MNAFEAKVVQEHAAELVAGDPLAFPTIDPARPMNVVLRAVGKTVSLPDVVKALGNIDANRVAHHLMARGYMPSEADPNIFETTTYDFETIASRYHFTVRPSPASKLTIGE